MMDRYPRGRGFKSPPGQKIWLYVRPLANSAIMSTLTVHCRWDDETVRERTGHPPSYAEAKKMKSLTLHTHGCFRASSRDCSSSPPPPLYLLPLSLPREDIELSAQLLQALIALIHKL